MSDWIFSATQISTYELCPRKWAWKYIDDVQAPPNKWAEFGKKTHKYLEHWLKSSAVPDESAEGRVAQAIIPLLPVPQLVRPEHVEMDFTVSIGLVPFRGVIDLWLPKGPSGRPFVSDHKTTSDFEWALKPEAMPDDVQATLYAYWALMETRASEVDVQWTYGLTRGAPKAKPVTRSLCGRDVQARVSRTAELAREALLIKESGLRAKDVPYDASACEAYGGCPYRALCNLSPEERIESIMSQGTAKEDLLNKLKSRNKNGAGAAINPPLPPEAAAAPAAAVVPVAAPTGAPNPLLARLQAKRAEAPPPVAVAAVAPAVAPVVAEASAPAPAATSEAEAPRRGPGRPRKDEAVTDAMLWPQFAAGALPPLVEMAAETDLADADIRGGVVSLAAGIADALVKEYRARFPA